MDESQWSCANLYECSSDNLDRLIGIAKENKALGGRLTGAGWGGCAVIMVYNEYADSIINSLASQFYSNME